MSRPIRACFSIRATLASPHALRSTVGVLVLATSTLACGATDPEAETIVGTEAPLVERTGTPHWPGSPAVLKIRMLSDRTVVNPEGGTYSTAETLMTVLKHTWSAVAKVDFQFVDVPPATGPYVTVAVFRTPISGNVAGSADELGVPRSGREALVRLSVCDPTPECWHRRPGPGEVPGLECYPGDGVFEIDCTGGWELFRANVIHEFGHVLGFSHEQQRSDTPGTVGPGGWCADASAASRAQDPGNTGFLAQETFLTESYDKDSIMNYCRDQNNDQRPDGYITEDTQNDRLSEADIAGVRAVYGTRPSPATSNSLYVQQGAALWRITPATGAFRRISGSIDWSDASSMTMLHQELYVIQGSHLHRVSPFNGAFTVLGGADWPGETLLTGFSESLYIVQGDGLWQVDDLETGNYRQLGAGWTGSLAMTNLNGWLYIIHGGQIYRVDPRNGGWTPVGPPDFPGATTIAGNDNALYITEGAGLWKFDLATNTYARFGKGNWTAATATAFLGGSMYIVNGSDLNRVDLSTKKTVVVGTADWAGTRVLAPVF